MFTQKNKLTLDLDRHAISITPSPSLPTADYPPRQILHLNNNIARNATFFKSQRFKEND